MGKIVLALAITLALGTAAFAQGGGAGSKGFKGKGGGVGQSFEGNGGSRGGRLIEGGASGHAFKAGGGNGPEVVAMKGGGEIRTVYLNHEGAGTHPTASIAQGGGAGSRGGKGNGIGRCSGPNCKSGDGIRPSSNAGTHG